MKKVTVIQPLLLASGVVALTKAQAKSRAHCLLETEETYNKLSVFEIQHQIQFKKGESVYLEDIPKSIYPCVDFKGKGEESEEESDDKDPDKKSEKEPKKDPEKTDKTETKDNEDK